MSDELRNPSLSELEFLVGDWDLALSRAAFLSDPDAEVHGRVEVRAIEDGNLLAMRQVVDPRRRRPPRGSSAVTKLAPATRRCTPMTEESPGSTR
jgi:hypothetical protein